MDQRRLVFELVKKAETKNRTNNRGTQQLQTVPKTLEIKLGFGELGWVVTLPTGELGTQPLGTLLGVPV